MRKVRTSPAGPGSGVPGEEAHEGVLKSVKAASGEEEPQPKYSRKQQGSD